MHRGALLLLVLSSVLAGRAVAQSPPPDGLYEDFSSLTMAPVGPLTSTPAFLPRWVEVSTTGRTTTVTFLPDRRVVWEVDWGADGPTEKRVEVDGVHFLRSRFSYDGSGHLLRKTVDGPGAPGGLTYDYATDATGRVVRRTAHLPPTTPSAGATGTDEELTVVWSADHAEVRTSYDGALFREDVIGLDGRLLSTTLHAAGGTDVARLDYARDASGTLTAITRTLPGGRCGPVDPSHPDPGLRTDDVSLVVGWRLPVHPLERHEALLFLGAPSTSSDEGRGSQREIHDDWGIDCWMNEVSGIHFDAAGHASRGWVSCICGFCVDATLDATAASEVLATDLHWTAGPWIRLDGTVDVTADHDVMTPGGPVAAGDLAAGDVVLDAAGRPRALVSVEPLSRGELRLGRNLRTEDGTFAAGGFLFASEDLVVCGPL